MTAPSYGCQLQGEGESHQVSWLITHLNPAGTISLCDEDFAIGVIHLLATDLGADPERLYAALERFVKAEAARQAREAAKDAPVITAIIGPDGKDTGQTVLTDPATGETRPLVATPVDPGEDGGGG